MKRRFKRKPWHTLDFILRYRFDNNDHKHHLLYGNNTDDNIKHRIFFRMHKLDRIRWERFLKSK